MELYEISCGSRILVVHLLAREVKWQSCILGRMRMCMNYVIERRWVLLHVKFRDNNGVGYVCLDLQI